MTISTPAGARISNTDLSQRAIRGGFWVLGIRLIFLTFSLARLVILARFLDSYEFGLMGIALLTMTSIDTFSQTGFYQALIQKKGNITHYLDAAWTFLILRGVGITSIIFMISPYAAQFFDAPEAALIIGVTGLSMLLQSFVNIGVVYFQKDLDFKRQFIYTVGGGVADFSVAVVAVLVFGSVWALVFGLLAGHAARLCASYLIHPWRPKWNLDFKKAKELFGFGRWILFSVILVFLATQVDSIIVGSMIGVAALGFYQMAYTLASTPTTEIAHVISQVTFPAYSKVQESMKSLRTAYLRVLQTTSYISFGLACFVFVLADDFTTLFLGVKWASIVPVMRILVVAGAIRSIAATTGPVFAAIGRPRIETSWQLVRFSVLIVSVFPLAILWGLNGAAIAVLASISASTIGFVSSVVKVTGCTYGRFLKILSIPIALTAATASMIMILRTALDIPIVLEFPTLVVSGGVIWWTLTLVFDRHAGYGMKPLLSTIVNPLRTRGLHK